MAGIEQLKAYHEAYKAALEVFRDWDTDSVDVLLQKYQPFQILVSPVIEAAGDNWQRASDLKRHVNCLGEYLLKGNVPKAQKDIWTIVFCDMPVLADYLLSLAAKKEKSGHSVTSTC
jgi:hypothetical protein